MKRAEIEEMLSNIRDYAAYGDYEAAHSVEDDLYLAFVRSCAKGTFGPAAQARAKEVLQSKEIHFPRHCA